MCTSIPQRRSSALVAGLPLRDHVLVRPCKSEAVTSSAAARSVSEPVVPKIAPKAPPANLRAPLPVGLISQPASSSSSASPGTSMAVQPPSEPEPKRQKERAPETDTDEEEATTAAGDDELTVWDAMTEADWDEDDVPKKRERRPWQRHSRGCSIDQPCPSAPRSCLPCESRSPVGI